MWIYGNYDSWGCAEDYSIASVTLVSSVFGVFGGGLIESCINFWRDRVLIIECQITASHRSHIFGESHIRPLVLSKNSHGHGTLIVKGVKKSFPRALLTRRIKPIPLLTWSQQVIHIWFDTSLRCEAHLDRTLGKRVLYTKSFHGKMAAVWVEVVVLATG